MRATLLKSPGSTRAAASGAKSPGSRDAAKLMLARSCRMRNTNNRVALLELFIQRRIDAGSYRRQSKNVLWRLLATLVTIAVAGLLWSTAAPAHARLIDASPAPHATVAAPRMIRLRLSEEIVKKFSSLKLSAAGGKPVAMTAKQSQDASILEAAPDSVLTPGTYTVTWTAVSTDDGHKTTGTFSFTVK
jgi:copper resistance protein C